MITFLRKMPIAEITKVDTEIQNKWTLYKKKNQAQIVSRVFLPNCHD